MLKLYEYTDQYLSALNDFEDMDLPDNVISDTLEGLKGEIKIKSQNIASFIRNMDSTVDLLKQHELQTRNKRLAIEKRIAWLKNYLLTNMQASDYTEISCPLFTIKQRKNPPSVWVTNEKLISDKYKTEIVVLKVNKKAIAEDLKAGKPVSGAELHYGWRLEIK